MFKFNKKFKLMLTIRATALAVTVCKLSWFISNHFVSIHF